MNTLELETEQKIGTSTKIALAFVVATAVMVIASFSAAMILRFTQPKATAVAPVMTTQTRTFAAPGVTIAPTSLNGVTYDSAIVSTNQ